MKSEYQIAIIGKIRKLREKHGYSQAQLATVLGISNGQLGNIESVKTTHKYTLTQIYKISQLFNEPVERVLSVDEIPTNTNDIVDCLMQSIVKYEE